MKIAILTLGCKVNKYESDALIYNLGLKGFDTTDALEAADVYVVNTCAVTQEAEKKSRQMIARCRKFNKNAKIFVCGCASQNNPDQFLQKDVEFVSGVAGKIKISDYIEKLAQNDSRIKIVYHEKNRGLGGARNTGLKEATGDYIFFLDSDDWLQNNCVQEVLNIFKELDLDTVWFKPNVYWEESQQKTDISPMFPYYAQCKGGYEILDENNLINYPLYSWNKAYKREFLIKNNLKWRENVYFEDVEFYFQTFIKSPEIYIINKPLYNYRRRDDSIISSATREIEKAKDLYYVTAEVYKYLKKENLLKKYKKAYAKYVVDALNMFVAFSDTYEKLMPIMQNFLKEINYPEDFQ